MLVKAKHSFAGVISMGEGEERELSEGAVLKDLLSAGYVEEVKKKAVKQSESKRGNKSNNS